MNHSNGLEYIVRGYSRPNYSNISYFSGINDGNYRFHGTKQIIFEPQYTKVSAANSQYGKNQHYSASYEVHSFAPEIFLNPSRPKTQFIDDKSKIIGIAEEAFELVLKQKLPENISVNILPLHEFKEAHSIFGPWSNGILGFSINGMNKKIFVLENHLDDVMLVIGHEIGHLLTETLPNKHDEEAKAFAFSIEWAKAIKKHNVANLGLSIKDELDFKPARNGLHDVAFGFVDFMVKKGRTAMQLHDDLVKKYVSVFGRVY